MLLLIKLIKSERKGIYNTLLKIKVLHDAIEEP